MQKKDKKKETLARRNGILLMVAGVAAAIAIIGVMVSQGESDGKTGGRTGSGSAAGQTTEAPEKASAAETSLITGADGLDVTHFADIEIEGLGTVTAALDANIAPVTVQNFVSLAGEGFYDGLTFHRIIDGFMIQGGDPKGDGTGGSDKDIKGEFAENGVENPISHVRGAISMARAMDPNSASSQFFIVQSDSTFLDGSYAGFGFVTEGMDIVDKIAKDAKPTDGNGSIKKGEQPVIKSIVIREAGE